MKGVRFQWYQPFDELDLTSDKPDGTINMRKPKPDVTIPRISLVGHIKRYFFRRRREPDTDPQVDGDFEWGSPPRPLRMKVPGQEELRELPYECLDPPVAPGWELTQRPARPIESADEIFARMSQRQRKRTLGE